MYDNFKTTGGKKLLAYFKESIFVTVVGFICAYIWAEHMHPGSGFLALFIVLFLSILEVTLSFDNAVVNAMKLEHMSHEWRHRFLTWGIAIAVFGMRFLFPVLVVAIFSHHNIVEVVKMAVYDVTQYTHYLHVAHAPLVSFGGTFLMMLFLTYFINEKKEVHWIAPVENFFVHFDKIKSIEAMLTLICLVIFSHYNAPEHKVGVLVAGILGVVLFLIIDGISHMLERFEEESKKRSLVDGAAKTGFVSFLYLELIDASFSLDGVLGAFAISKDIIIITIGLAIGAMFVRSLTIFMVEKNTLKHYAYLEHGAHYAIGFLAFIMLFSTIKEVPEVVTGMVGLVIVGAAFITSVIENKRNEAEIEKIEEKTEVKQD